MRHTVILCYRESCYCKWKKYYRKNRIEGGKSKLKVEHASLHDTLLSQEVVSLTATYDVLRQSRRGAQHLSVIKAGEHWRAGDEIEQLGIIQQELVDLHGAVINNVCK